MTPKMTAAAEEVDRTLATRPWTAAERAHHAAEMRRKVADMARQWRSALGEDEVAPLESSAAYAFDLRRIEPLPGPRPVFILGEARSGTTAMLRGLRDGAGLFAWDEGHLFPMLPSVLSAVMKAAAQYARDEARPPMSWAIDHFEPYRVLNDIVCSHDAIYAHAAGDKRWADKTPNVASLVAVPLLDRIYPGARFVFMHRHPVSLLRSRLRKFPRLSLETGIIGWAATMTGWGELKRLIDPSKRIEVPQAQLTSRAAAIADALELTTQQRDAFAAYVSLERPEATSAGQAEATLDDVDWPDDVKQWTADLCGSLSRGYGYSLRRTEGSS